MKRDGYRLYIANMNYSSWSLRPWLLMTELGIPFKEHILPFGDEPAWAEYRTVCPSGKVPCLVDGDTLVWDSLAITEYLAERHEGIWPDESSARTWGRCVAAEMHSGFSTLRNVCGMNVGLRIDLYESSPALKADVARIDQIWTEGVNRFGGPYLAGENFSAVDAFFAPVAFRVQTFALQLGPVSTEYCRHLLANDGMTQWQQRALREPWIDEAHELEAAQYGKVTEDHRQR